MVVGQMINLWSLLNRELRMFKASTSQFSQVTPPSLPDNATKSYCLKYLHFPLQLHSGLDLHLQLYFISSVPLIPSPGTGMANFIWIFSAALVSESLFLIKSCRLAWNIIENRFRLRCFLVNFATFKEKLKGIKFTSVQW